MKIFLYSSSICTSRAPPCILLKYVPFEQLTRAFSIDNNFVHGIEVVNHIGSLVTIEGTKVRIKRECKIECKNSRVGGNLLFSFFLYSSSFFAAIIFTYHTNVPMLIHSRYPTKSKRIKKLKFTALDQATFPFSLTL